MMPAYIKLFNSVFYRTLSVAALIKLKQYYMNRQGICVSSCLGNTILLLFEPFKGYCKVIYSELT